MSYTLRPFKSGDVFTMSRILKAMKLSVMDLNIKTETPMEQVGVEFFKMVFENLHLAEKEVSEFIADLAGISVEEFNELPLEDGISLISQLKEQKGIIDFLKSAAKSMK